MGRASGGYKEDPAPVAGDLVSIVTYFLTARPLHRNSQALYTAFLLPLLQHCVRVRLVADRISPLRT